MKIGIIVEGQEGLSWDMWRRLVAQTEDLGFDSLWRSDHLFSIIDEAREAHETWLALTVAALETQRLQIGSLVSPMTFRHPAMLAKLAASVDSLSKGRLVLGVGAGWNDREHRAHGLPFPPFQERLDRLQEGIEIILGLHGEGPFHYQGQYYEVETANPYPKPVEKIPLLIGGKGRERFMRLVARYADEWNMTTNSPSFYRERSEALEAQCRAVGRDPATIRRSVAAGILIGRSAQEIGRRCIAMQRLMPELAGVSTAEVPEALRAVGWVCGKPDEIVQRLRELAAVGIDRIMLEYNDVDDEDVFELIAREVMPGLEDA
ncbi:TIGR03560 family F420-dependent LLM class oxidoreductase [Candidatus Entotheonella palauensis]|uniref:TIGR03560 family F420-dependent LLM class oxidoreductase n=1 Tax=Candidatus Entotheonella palauensis TaxID=93172 RepID=UPI000B7EC8B0|nr:TIGR03560 family F420-dependent LLM class oxidoreductase [Candidatus Entotheonella palauensis]